MIFYQFISILKKTWFAVVQNAIYVVYSIKCVHSFFLAFNTLRPRQNGHHFADDPFRCIFLNETVRIAIKFSPKFVPTCQMNNIRALGQIMTLCQPGNKPLSEPMMVRLPMHICVTRPHLIKALFLAYSCDLFTHILQGNITYNMIVPVTVKYPCQVWVKLTITKPQQNITTHKSCSECGMSPSCHFRGYYTVTLPCTQVDTTHLNIRTCS